MTAQVAADLRAAADVIERDGWTQGRAHANGCHCATGAIALVTGAHVLDGERLLLLDELEGPRSRWQWADVFLAGHIGERVPEWNDQPGRTAEEVITTLRAAADKADKS